MSFEGMAWLKVKRCEEQQMGRTKKFTDEQLWDATRELLLQVGYDAFTVSLLAERMNVSRAVIYKYYPNKEELIVQFMLEKMETSVAYLTEIDRTQAFKEMFRDVLARIFEMKDLHQVLSMASKIGNVTNVVTEKKAQLSKMHHEMYEPLLYLIAKGKEEGIIAQYKSDVLMLSFIFSAINIPNHMSLTHDEFIQELEQLLLNGLSGK